MKVVYAREPLQKSIFLAGPTPRDANGIDWRPEAIGILEEMQFDGLVFSPTSGPGTEWAANYDDQVHWEWEAIDQSTVTVFWVPRVIKHMPAFTTNVEFGLVVGKGQVVLGYPMDAPKMKYLEKLAVRYNIPVYFDLIAVLEYAVNICREPYGVM